MPPTATSHQDWVQLLSQIEERNGVIELTTLEVRPESETKIVVSAPGAFEAIDHPVWRVRLLKIDGDSLIVEKPTSANQADMMRVGEALGGLIIDGPSRWMFRTQVVESVRIDLNNDKRALGMRLTWPIDIRSAQRRNFFRVDTSAADIPRLRAWALLKPGSVIESHQANRALHKSGAMDAGFPAEPMLGESFQATMLDLSGGGLRILLSPGAQTILEKWPLLWLRLDLPPIPHPVYVVAKIAHWRLDPPHRVIAGLSFHFDEEPAHASFVTDVICRFAAQIQRLQLQRKK